MREILYRGKRVDNGKWVEGYYCPCVINGFPADDCIISKERLDIGCWTPDRIIPESIGQYTGIKDKNGKKIFEGDIVKTKYGRLCVVEWRSTPCFCGFDLMVCVNWDDFGNAPSSWDLYMPQNLEIVDNIYDNPNLLNKES